MKVTNAQLQRYSPLRAPGWMAISRGAGLALGILFALNLAEVLAYSTSSVENWFCRLTPLTQQLCTGMLALAATACLLFSVFPALPAPVRLTGVIVLLAFVGFCGWELRSQLGSHPETERSFVMARPLGVIMIIAVTLFGMHLGSSGHVRGRSSLIAIVLAAVLSLAAFAVVSIQTGGLADSVPNNTAVIVVVVSPPTSQQGAAEVLDDRLTTVSEILKDKEAKSVLLVTDTASKNLFSEDAMREAATTAGIAAEKIQNVSITLTEAERAQALSRIPEFRESPTVILVGHWHELERYRLWLRRSGIRMVGIPARQTHAVFGQNMLVAREALWFLMACAEPVKHLAASPQTAPVTDDKEDAGKEVDSLEFDFESDKETM